MTKMFFLSHLKEQNPIERDFAFLLSKGKARILLWWFLHTVEMTMKIIDLCHYFVCLSVPTLKLSLCQKWWFVFSIVVTVLTSLRMFLHSTTTSFPLDLQVFFKPRQQTSKGHAEVVWPPMVLIMSPLTQQFCRGLVDNGWAKKTKKTKNKKQKTKNHKLTYILSYLLT